MSAARLCANPDVWRPLRFRISTQGPARTPDKHASSRQVSASARKPLQASAPGHGSLGTQGAHAPTYLTQANRLRGHLAVHLFHAVGGELGPSQHHQVRVPGHPRAFGRFWMSTIADFTLPGTVKSVFRDIRGTARGLRKRRRLGKRPGCPASRTSSFPARSSPRSWTSEGSRASQDVRHRGLHLSRHGQVRVPGHPRAPGQVPWMRSE